MFTALLLSLFLPNLKEGDTILDPCIGPNTFLSRLDKLDYPIQVTGMEIDRTLISDEIESYYSKPNRQLILDSFFNLALSETFDFIIQNPPYVRQELMMDGVNSKLQATKNIPLSKELIPLKSNLYVYFLLKSIFHLKDQGRLIAVLYDSWLYSDFGKMLKDAFIRLGAIEAIYHFKKDAFPDADIGATVIDFKRIVTPNQKKEAIKLYSLKTIEEIHNNPKSKGVYKTIPTEYFPHFRFNEETVIDFKSELFKPLEHIGNRIIRRGTASIVNKHFIQNKPVFEECIPFIKDVTKIRSFSVGEELSYLLVVKDTMSDKTKIHIETAKREILRSSEKFKALKGEIEKNKDWYKVQLKTPGNIIFNYYLRQNIDFLLNEKLHYPSDNFYILNIEKNLLANFAVLNSSFTRIAILLHARNQGNGLRKVQLYEFKKIPVLDISNFSDSVIIELETVGEKLKSVNRFSAEKQAMIGLIDGILIKEYNKNRETPITVEQLYKDIQNIYSINQDDTTLV